MSATFVFGKKSKFLMEKIETRKLDGYEVIFEIDRKKRIRRCIEKIGSQDSLILLEKKVETYD
jgi:hypothetical protein